MLADTTVWRSYPEPQEDTGADDLERPVVLEEGWQEEETLKQ